MNWADDLMALSPEEYDSLMRQVRRDLESLEAIDLDLDRTTIARANPDGSYTEIRSTREQLRRIGPFKIVNPDIDGEGE